MFNPSPEIAALTKHSSRLFHVMIGLDPLGDFMSVDGLSYEMPVFEYKELGRNHSKLSLPFDDPGRVGEVTLKWGMVIRSKLFNWIQSVESGEDFMRTVYVFHLSRKRRPLRIYTLSGCFPTSWSASEFSQENSDMSTEEVKLQCDQIRMTNLSAIALATGASGAFGSTTLPSFTERQGDPRIESIVRSQPRPRNEPVSFDLPVFNALETSDGGEFDFVFSGLPRNYELVPRPPDGRKFAMHFRFANPDHDYVASARQRAAYIGEYVGEAGDPMETRPYYTPGEGGELEGPGERKAYEALVGDWSNAIRLERTYEAQTGAVSFYGDEEDE